MANGTPLTFFNSFQEATGPLYITAPDAVINDAQLRRTYSFGALMGGDHGKKEMMSGGNELRFATFFETGGRTRFHQPGATHTWANPQKLIHGRAAWRFLISDMSWTIQEIMLNEKLANPGEHNFDQYVNLKIQKEQMMWTDKWDFIEGHTWSEPDFTEMETMAGGETGKWYSIPAFINEYGSGLFNSAGTAGTAWTTIHGLDPTSSVQGQNRFVQSTVTYSNEVTTTDELPSGGTILAAFSKMWKKVHFEVPPTMDQYWSNPAYNHQHIFTSPEGHTAYEMMLRAFQDTYVIGTRQDPAYPDPTYNFIPIKYVDVLTTATLYPNNTTLASATDNIAEGTNATGDRQGPRYYWINSEYLYPCFHSEMFFETQKIREHFNDPDTFVQPVRTWGNLKCTSRMRQGLVRPSQATYASLYA